MQPFSCKQKKGSAHISGQHGEAGKAAPSCTHSSPGASYVGEKPFQTEALSSRVSSLLQGERRTWLELVPPESSIHPQFTGNPGNLRRVE